MQQGGGEAGSCWLLHEVPQALGPGRPGFEVRQLCGLLGYAPPSSSPKLCLLGDPAPTGCWNVLSWQKWDQPGIRPAKWASSQERREAGAWEMPPSPRLLLASPVPHPALPFQQPVRD